MSTYTTYLSDLQRHFSRWAVPAPYGEQLLSEISGNAVPLNDRTVTAYYSSSALSKATYVRDNVDPAVADGAAKAQLVIDTLIARRDGLPDPQPAPVEPPAPAPFSWVRQEPAAPIVTTDPIDRGSAGLSGWGDGEISNYHVTVGGHLIAPSQPLTGLQISDIKADKVSSLLTQSSGATLNDLVIRRVEIGARNKAVFIRGASRNVLIEDGVFFKVGGPGKPSDYPEGVMLGAKISGGDDTVEATMRRCIVRDFATAAPSGYIQGDNIMVEGGQGPFLFEDVLVEGATDGGFDCKAYNVTFRRVEARSNHTNYKLWGSGHFESGRSITPKPNPSGSGSPTCAFWFPSDLDQTWTFDEFEFVGEHLKHIINGGDGKVTLHFKKCNIAEADMVVARGAGLTIIIDEVIPSPAA